MTLSAAAAAASRWLRPGKGALVLPPLLFVGVLLLLPVAFISLYSVGLRTNIPGMPTAFSLSNWSDFLTGGGSAFRSRFVYSMEIALFVSVLTTIAAYPLAYFLAFVARRRRYALLLVLLAPFFTSYLLRVIAWQIILNNNGVVNSLLWTLHLRPHGSAISWLIYSNFSVALVLFYTWIPFVVPADLRRAGEHGPPAPGGGRGPRREPGGNVLAGDNAAEPARRDRGLRVRADPDDRRVHHAAAGRRPEQPAVRQLHPGVLRRHAQLELRIGARDRAHRGRDRADAGLRALPADRPARRAGAGK